MAAQVARPLHVLLVALGLLLAQGPVLLHLLLVPHTTCEHGELIHAAAAPSRWGLRPQTPRPSDTQAAQAGTQGRPEVRALHTASAGHEHCDALAVRHRIAEVGPAVACASLSWIEPPTVSGERSEMRAVPLLSLAPKSSPPV